MRVFISSSYKDIDFALILKDFLVRNDNDLLIYTSNDNSFPMVNDFYRSFFNEIENADIYIPILSKNYYSSKYCIIELGIMITLFYKEQKKIFPFCIYPMHPEDALLNTPLSHLECYDLSDPDAIGSLYKKITTERAISNDNFVRFTYEIKKTVLSHNDVYNRINDVGVYAYGKDLIIKNVNDYVTYQKNDDNKEIEVSYSLNPYELQNPIKPEFISLVLKYNNSLDLYSFIDSNKNARIKFELDNAKPSISKLRVEIKYSFGRYVEVPAELSIDKGISEHDIPLLDFKSKHLREVDEICFVLRPEYAIEENGKFIIKDLRVSLN